MAEARSGLQLLDLLEGADTVIVVHALRVGPGSAEPGAVVRLSLPAAVAAAGIPDLERFGLSETVDVARALGRWPDIVALGVQAEDVSPGSLMTPAVASAVPRLVHATVVEATAASARRPRVTSR